MRIAVVAAILLAATAVASAQPALTPPVEAPPEVASESSATMLAVGATLGGLALAAAGAEHGTNTAVLGGTALMLIGPSAGHFYAGETGHGVKMTLLRTGGALVLGLGVIMSTAAADCGPGGACSTEDSHANGEKMMWIGGATLLGATLYDLWDAHNAARRANERAARRWTVAPSIMAGANGGTLPAVTIGGAF